MEEETIQPIEEAEVREATPEVDPEVAPAPETPAPQISTELKDYINFNNFKLKFNNFRLKITREGIAFEKNKRGRKSKRNSSQGLSTFSEYTNPLSQDKQDVLRSGGWSEEDIKRMMMTKPKMRVYADGGYAYI